MKDLTPRPPSRFGKGEKSTIYRYKFLSPLPFRGEVL